MLYRHAVESLIVGDLCTQIAGAPVKEPTASQYSEEDQHQHTANRMYAVIMMYLCSKGSCSLDVIGLSDEIQLRIFVLITFSVILQLSCD